MRPNPHATARATLREARMALASVNLRCRQCGKACRDDAAVARHVDVNHPKFPPVEEGCSE